MIDIAKLLAQQPNVKVTIVTTPLNAIRYTPTLKEHINARLPVRFLELPFPVAEDGLPEGCESADALPGLHLLPNFSVAIDMLQERLEQRFDSLKPRPSCILSDKFMLWTADTAINHQIPRIVFDGMSCFKQDGHNPFLELTLRARKKISSVINHIHSKWGASTIAVGDPTLLPYESHTSMNSSRWTSNDTSITVGDVYTVVKSPTVFRLSYGWFSNHEPPSVSETTAPHNCITSESIQKQIQTTQERKCLDSTTAEVDDTEHLIASVH